MPVGVDASTSCLAATPALAARGVEFVGRYYANRGKKVLTKPEALAIARAGMKVVAIWEDGYPTKASYFSYAKGVDDGTSAFHDALSLGQPPDSPIYFAVDYDASVEEIAGCISDYFRGLRDGFHTIAAGGSAHPLGVYGSGATCSWLLTRNFVTYTWLSKSGGYRGSKDFSAWNLKQGETEKRCGVQVDRDEAIGDYGGFAILL